MMEKILTYQEVHNGKPVTFTTYKRELSTYGGMVVCVAVKMEGKIVRYHFFHKETGRMLNINDIINVNQSNKRIPNPSKEGV